MYIKELILTDFGKFKNKKISLTKNFNLIYGKNEAGKSTIHSFIEGMFYGFAKVGAKRKSYTNQIDKYLPWSGADYRGVLLLDYKNEEYRIERSFLKDKEYTKVYNNTRGEEITKDINLLENARIEQPGVFFLGLSKAVFENTMYIPQLKIKTNENIKESLTDKFVNFNLSRDENISVRKSVDYLDSLLKEIGTEGAKKSKLGSMKNKLSNLKDELNSKTYKKLDYEKEIEETNVIEKKINNTKLSLDKWEIKKRIYEEKIEHENYLKILENNKIISNIDLRINEFEVNNDLSIDYKKCLENNNLLQLHSSKIDDLLIQNKNLLEENSRKSIEVNQNVESLIEDSKLYARLMEEERELNKTNYSKEREFLSKDISNMEKEKRKLLLIIVLQVFVSGVIIFSSFVFKKYFLALLLFIPGIYIYLRTGNLRRKIELIKRLNSQMEKLREFSYVKKIKRDEIDLSTLELFNKYGVSSRLELENYFDENLNVIKEFEIRSKFNDNLIASNKEKINALSNNIIELEDEIEIILKKYNCSRLYDLEKMAKSNNLENLIAEKNSLMEINKILLGEGSLSSLNHEESYSTDIESKEVILENISKYKERLNKLSTEMLKSEERIYLLESEVKNLQNIQEEIKYLEREIEILINTKDEIELAKDTILEISNENRSNFAPILNSETSQILEEITNGKYTELLVDTDNEIRVLDREYNEYIKLKYLSLGTIDQIYLAFRLAILKILEKDSAPLILDDSFNQYDDYRLRNILIILKRLNRQIILFTSQNREQNILTEIGAEFNRVIL